MSTLLMFANLIAVPTFILGGLRCGFILIGFLDGEQTPSTLLQNSILPGAAAAWLVATWLTGGL